MAAVSHGDLEAGGITRCPACGSAETAQVGGPATAFQATAGEKTFLQPAYAIRSCADCGLYFKSHTMSAADLDDYYSRLEYETYEVGATFPTERRLRRWLGGLPIGSRVLDFGCSSGRMLKDLNGRASCFGVEVNDTAAAIARGRGITILTEQELRQRQQRDFDAILLADVYEHLFRPVQLVAMLAGLLKPGGWLAVVTGNADAIRDRGRLAEFWYFRVPGHLQMASARHMTWLGTRVGLRVDELYGCSHYATPIAERVRQFVQSFAYRRFRDAPHGGVAALLRAVPRVRCAEHWSTAPALRFTKDHLVVVFRRPEGHEW